MHKAPRQLALIAKKYDRIVRFLAIGIINTAFGYALFAVVFLVCRNHNIALVVSTISGIIFNFFTTGKYVFGNNTWKTLIPFCFAYGVAFMINLIILNAITFFGFSALIGQAVSLPAVVVISYIINSRLVFRRASLD